MSELQRKLEDVISAVLNEHETSMLTRWVLMAETVDAQGDRGLWTFTHSNASAWDTCGLLQYGLLLEQARVKEVQ